MNRREALSKVALILGGTVVGAEAFAAGIQLNPGITASQLFTTEDEKILHEIGGTILPAINGKPGAKDAGIGTFMVMMVTDCYKPEQQKVFIEGLQKIKTEFKSNYGKSFLEADEQTRLAFLQKLDTEQREASKDVKSSRQVLSLTGPPVHYFLMMRQLTILGYCTSKVGATKGLRYIEAPGYYNSCVPYKKGEGAWAT